MNREDQNVTAGKSFRKKVIYIMVAVLFLAMIFFVWLGGGGYRTNWLDMRHAAGSFLDVRFFMFFGIALVSMAGLLAIAAFLLRDGRKKRDPQEGTILIEFAMLLPIALMLALLMLQSTMLMGGYMTVHYASFCAARAAIVYVPQPWEDQGGEGWNKIDVLNEGSEKMTRIRDAAIWAVMPVSDSGYESSSSKADFLKPGLQALYRAYDQDPPEWVEKWLSSKFAYAEANTSIEVDPPIDGIQFGEHEDVHVTVKHNLYLSIPYASAIIAGLDPDGIELGNGKYALRVEVPCTLTNEGSNDVIDIEVFPD